VSASRLGWLAATATLAACAPHSVNLREISPMQYSVAVNTKATPDCVAESHKRAEREARRYCEAHGRELRAGPVDRQGSSETSCRVELIFTCALPRA
jgi:hypothetical protein